MVEKRVRNDFRSIFASCAQARTCEKPIKTLGFYRFYACRLFFERVGLLVQRSIEKTLKSALLSTQNRPKIDQNRSSERFLSHLGRPSRSKVPLRAILSRLVRSKQPVGATVEATWVDLGWVPVAAGTPESPGGGNSNSIIEIMWYRSLGILTFP